MASGTYAEFATGPRTCHFDASLARGEVEEDSAAEEGEPATKSPTPMSGKHVIVGATSPGWSTLRIRLRRSRILRSTLSFAVSSFRTWEGEKEKSTTDDEKGAHVDT